MNSNQKNDNAQVLVIGAGGYFGNLLVKELIHYTSCHILAGGRDKKKLEKLCQLIRSPERIRPYVMDLNNFNSWKESLESCQVVICAAGPFQKISTETLQLCIERNVHYIDFADDRNFVVNVYKTLKNHNNICSTICTGWSTVPALSGALSAIATQDMESVDAIFIHMAPGNRSPRSKSTIYSLLASVGQSFTRYQSGKWDYVTGWSNPRLFEFPEPIGQRVGYLVNVPDLEIFPQIFGAGLVEFRVSPELAIFNHLLSILAWSVRAKLVNHWQVFTGLIQSIVSLFRAYGHDWGAVGVEAYGKRHGLSIKKKITLLAERAGQNIAVMPATIMVSRLLSEKAQFKGLVPVNNWITMDELMAECDLRGYRLVIEEMPE